jgi:hypothetical protein
MKNDLINALDSLANAEMNAANEKLQAELAAHKQAEIDASAAWSALEGRWVNDGEGNWTWVGHSMDDHPDFGAIRREADEAAFSTYNMAMAAAQREMKLAKELRNSSNLDFLSADANLFAAQNAAADAGSSQPMGCP